MQVRRVGSASCWKGGWGAIHAGKEGGERLMQVRRVLGAACMFGAQGV